MAVNITVSISEQQAKALKEQSVSPSALMRAAINQLLGGEDWLMSETQYRERLLKLQNHSDILQNELLEARRKLDVYMAKENIKSTADQ